VQTVLYFQSPSKTVAAGKKLAGARDAAATFGWHVQVVEDKPTARSVRELVRFWSPVGAIVECGGATRPADPRLFASLPTAFFDRDPGTLPKNVACVYHDSHETAACAARELISADTPNFAFVHPAQRHFWSDAREEGFRQALAINSRSVHVFPPVGTRNPIVFLRKLQAFLQQLPRPCAAFAANDNTAQGVMTAAKMLGFRVPDDFAVVGVDNDIDVCLHLTTPLSSVEPDFRRGGRMAIFLLNRIRDGAKGAALRQTFGPLQLVRRASTRRLLAHDPEVDAALTRIHSEACQGLTAAGVLADFGCSRGQAEIRFRAATGNSVLDEIQAVRLTRAKELLAIPSIQIKAIADFCGYKTPNALAKLFHASTGMTMREYRRLHAH